MGARGGVRARLPMKVSPSSLREGWWYEYLVRFGLGGAATAFTGLISKSLRSVDRRSLSRAPGDLLRQRDLNREARTPSQTGGWSRREAARAGGRRARCRRCRTGRSRYARLRRSVLVPRRAERRRRIHRRFAGLADRGRRRLVRAPAGPPCPIGTTRQRHRVVAVPLKPP